MTIEFPLHNDDLVLKSGHLFCNSRYVAEYANCNINAKTFLNLLLKMQREWRIAPEKR